MMDEGGPYVLLMAEDLVAQMRAVGAPGPGDGGLPFAIIVVSRVEDVPGDAWLALRQAGFAPTQHMAVVPGRRKAAEDRSGPALRCGDGGRIRLSQREAQVLEGVVSGASNKEIARDLCISPRTVESHRAHLMAKLGARRRSELIRIAREGVGRLDPT